MNKIIELIVKFLKFIFPGLFTENTNQEEITSNLNYVIKPLMTSSELVFYNKLIKIEGEGEYKVLPQVNLASIINKVSNQRYQSELYRNVDYGIFSKDLTKLYLLIELNDNTHNTQSRQIRDSKVKNICSQANIKLITFYTKYDNKESYVIERVKEEILKSQINDNNK